MQSSLVCDLLVYGSTAPGIVAAVRAAREGLDVVLVTPGMHLGGSLPSLGAFETHYRGVRAPLLQEFIDRVVDHYRLQHGEASEAFHVCARGPMVTFEPHVATKILGEWIAGEARIRHEIGFAPLSVEKEGRVIRAVVFRGISGDGLMRVTSRAVIEATYEGDLMALAGAEFRVGREARSEYVEPRAGRVFTRWVSGCHPRAAAEGRLNLVTAKATTSEPLPGSTGEGDDNIQSYSYRLCLTDDPANRRMIETPPVGYVREHFAPILLDPAEKAGLRLPFHHRFLIYTLAEMTAKDHIFHGHALPNRKRSWNATNLTGAGRNYPGGTREQRAVIAEGHREHALGLMYFLQFDAAVPSDIQGQARRWGLARNEFAGTDNFPPQLYVREARRLVGRANFTEHDALTESDARRAPVHADSIGITEFSLDSLACTTERLGDSLCDGQLFQMEVSRPGQVSYGALLPRDLDNLLVVTTISATHVGWGTVRQTPTLMHLAESAAWAVVLALEHDVLPAALDVDHLQRHLVGRGLMLSFFNDVDMASPGDWVPAMQYLGTKGFFGSYDARPGEPLTAGLAVLWAQATAAWMAGGARAEEWAMRVAEEEARESVPVTWAEFCALLQRAWGERFAKCALPPAPAQHVSRAVACQYCYQLLAKADRV